MNTITKIEPSLYFPTAKVLTTDCGHKHLRPAGMLAIGMQLNCPFCASEAIKKNTPYVEPSI
jgi:hypothetical protein